MKLNFLLIIFFFLMLFSSGEFVNNNCYAQEFKDEVKDFFKVGGDVFTAPAHFEKNDWIKLGFTAAATTGAFFLDKEVKRFFARNHNSTADFIFGIDGDIYMGAAAASIAGLYGYGAIADDSKIRNLGLQLGEATFYAGTINIISKMIIGRKRPNADCGCNSFNPLTTDIYNSSLPSTHTMLSFAFATVMANYSDNTLWQVTWYTLATFVGMARIYHNMHWFSDTVLGAAMGYYIGEFVTNHSTNNKKDTPAPVTLIPSGNLINLRISL